MRVTYNAAVFGGGAAVARPSIGWLGRQTVGGLLAAVGVAALLDYWVNLLLITLVVAVHSRRRFVTLVRTNTRATILPFALMASAALMLVVMWQRSAVLSAALVGPLIAISLYQRSTFRALRAMRLALTDPLTGLGNHRHFHERLQRELVAAEADGALAQPLPDRRRRLQARSTTTTAIRPATGSSRRSRRRLRQGGEAFRLGGDEFAVLLPGTRRGGGARDRRRRSSIGCARWRSSMASA